MWCRPAFRAAKLCSSVRGRVLTRSRLGAGYQRKILNGSFVQYPQAWDNPQGISFYSGVANQHIWQIFLENRLRNCSSAARKSTSNWTPQLKERTI